VVDFSLFDLNPQASGLAQCQVTGLMALN